jgi:hypothetical protein
MKKICLSLMAMVFFVSCQQTLSDSARESIENEIAEITDVTFSHFNDRDTSGIYLSFSDDFTGLSSGELIIVPEDWEKYKAKAKESFTTDAPMTFKITESRIDVMSPTVANHHFLFKRKTVLAEDMSSEIHAACTWTYVLETDGWKVRNSHVSNPLDYFRAAEGDTLFLAFHDVKADSKEEYERLSHEMLLDRISEADQQAEYISTLVRMLHPTEANEDGTFTYLYIFDPIYSGNYGFNTLNLYTKIYGEEKGKELDEQFAATLAGDQRSYTMIQSKK